MFDSLRENFELILIVLFLISTVTYAIYRATFYQHIKADLTANKDKLASLKKRERKQLRYHISESHLNSPWRKFVYFFADLFWVLLFVVTIRSFVFEPFIIPSASMKPGLQIGDIVIVNKFEKGLRLPVTNQRLNSGSAIERGDVLVFKYPKNPKISYIKRVVGLPGDKISYDNRTMIINGEVVKLKPLREENDKVDVQTQSGIVKQDDAYEVFEENLAGYPHTMRYSKNHPADYPAREWIVPEGNYLMMGDNRDNSQDGRFFGYLDDALVIGRATRIALNFDCLKGDGKCDRFFKAIK